MFWQQQTAPHNAGSGVSHAVAYRWLLRNALQRKVIVAVKERTVGRQRANAATACSYETVCAFLQVTHSVLHAPVQPYKPQKMPTDIEYGHVSIMLTGCIET